MGSAAQPPEAALAGRGKVRAFISIPISQETKAVLAATIRSLQREVVSGVRWVKPEAIHLTLKFLGQIDHAQVEAVLKAMGSAARRTGPLDLRLGGLGGFPNASSPRVIWIALKGDLDALGKLQAKVDDEMSRVMGSPKETRPFAPHLTLGRMRDSASGGERRIAGLALAKVETAEEAWWQVSEADLMRSTLTPSGAVYHRLGSCPL